MHKKSYSTLNFRKTDVAKACNMQMRQLQRICKRENIKLQLLSFDQLTLFVLKHHKNPLFNVDNGVDK